MAEERCAFDPLLIQSAPELHLSCLFYRRTATKMLFLSLLAAATQATLTISKRINGVFHG
jgi:hypothetical protein